MNLVVRPLAADILFRSSPPTLKHTLETIFWEHTTNYDEPGSYAVEAYILENFPLVDRVAPITHHLYINQEAPFGRTVEGSVDLSAALSQLQNHYPEYFL